jgi:hypothetical protein
MNHPFTIHVVEDQISTALPGRKRYNGTEAHAQLGSQILP